MQRLRFRESQNLRVLQAFASMPHLVVVNQSKWTGARVVSGLQTACTCVDQNPPKKFVSAGGEAKLSAKRCDGCWFGWDDGEPDRPQVASQVSWKRSRPASRVKAWLGAQGIIFLGDIGGIGCVGAKMRK